MILADNIVKSFGQKKVLTEVSLNVRKGEIFGLLGPSGAGKTTLIKILTGQLAPDSGAASLLGKTSAQLTGADHARIGIMMAEFGVYDRLSVYANLAVYADLFHIEKKKIDRTLREVGLYDAKNTPAGKISQGMKHRLQLARPFLLEPEILFLDEPTAGLDPATAGEIHEILARRKKTGCTVFLTTHNMAEAEKLCDRVALLNCGKIVEEGEPGALCRKYNSLKVLNIRKQSGETVTLPADATAADTVADLLRRGEVQAIHSSEPNLETVFLQLTGNKLDR